MHCLELEAQSLALTQVPLPSPFTTLSTYLSSYLFANSSILFYLSIHLFNYQSIYLFSYSFNYLYQHLCIYNHFIWQLASPLSFGEGVDAVQMPDQDQDPAVAEHCVVSGWGALEVSLIEQKCRYWKNQ